MARRLVGTRDQMGERALIGAALLGTAAMATAAVWERRAIARLLSRSFDRTARLGRVIAVATGVRRRPLYVRALPGAGIATGLIAAGCAAYVIASRMPSRRRMGLEEAERRPSGPRPPEGDVVHPPEPLHTLENPPARQGNPR